MVFFYKRKTRIHNRIIFLKFKVAHSQYPLVCSLEFDEMAIRQHLEFDGKLYHGYVDFGNGLGGDSVVWQKNL